MKITATLLSFILLLLNISFCAEEPQQSQIKGENYVDEMEGLYKYTIDLQIPYTLIEKNSLGKSNHPFRGFKYISKSKGYSVSIPWLDAKAKDILDFFKKKKTYENLLNNKSKTDIWKVLACKAFFEDLFSNLKDGQYKNEEELKNKIKNQYIESGLIYIHKYNNQFSVKKAPKFGSLTKVVQPMMTSFIYANKWIAISELYLNSKNFSKKNQEVYRDYFLNKSLMTIMRRRFEFPFKDKDLVWSILNMNDKIFVSYFREAIRKWIDRRQYRYSNKFETKVKSDTLPEAFKGAEISNEMP